MNCEHDYYVNELNLLECKNCGLLKSTIESTTNQQETQKYQMKTREEIETGLLKTLNNTKRMETVIAHQQTTILEVLLDIRELLIEQENARSKD